MDDMFEHGVIIGRFNPPHRGHIFLVDVAMRCSRAVTLFLCSLPTERIPGELRAQWLREAFPALTIVHITAANRDAAQGSPKAVEIWAHTVRSHLTRPADALFASEHYGAELAERLGAAFLPVDIKRELVPVSGRMLRKAPFRYWRYIPEVAKAYFVLPIIIDAPTLSRELRYAKALARHLRGGFFSPPTLVTTAPLLAQRYLAAQMAVSYRVITLCGQQFSDVAALLPQTYCAPLRISIRPARCFCCKVTVVAAEGQGERIRSSYCVLGYLKRISRYYLHKSAV